MSSEMLASAYNVLTGPANGLFGRAGNNSASNLPSPTALGNLSTWYDVSDKSSLTLDGSDNCQLIADKSGNSSENCLVLPGVSGNYASAPDAVALRPSTEVEIVSRLGCAWSAATTLAIQSKYPAGGNLGFLFRKDSATLQLILSNDGTAITTVTSTANVGFSDYVMGWVKVTWRASDGRVQFWTAPDQSTEPSSWDQLGADLNIAYANIFATTGVLEVGSRLVGTSINWFGRISRSILRTAIGGAAVFDADFTTASKLATSFTESSTNAATVTINSTAIALPARIHGARDLYMGSAASQPLYTTRNGRVGLLFDGVADYMKTAPFALSQPENVYFVGEQVTWTSTDYLMDGAASNSGAITQTTSTPQLNISAGTSVAANTGLSVQTAGVVNAVFNGASSSLRINRGTAATGNAGAANMTGLTVASAGTAGTYGNLFLSEALIYDTTAQDTATKDRIALYEGQKWGISV